MATKAFQKIYTKITQITKATCSLKATGVGYCVLAAVMYYGVDYLEKKLVLWRTHA